MKRNKHLYLPGPRRGVFHWQTTKGSAEVILAGSVLDAMTLYQAGMRNVSCVYGTQGLTADHEELLQRFRAQRVLLFLDGDAAGRQATEVLSHRLRRLGLAVGDVKLAGANDPNELWMRLGADEARRVLTDCVTSAREELGAAESGRAAASGAGTSSPLTVKSTIKEKKVTASSISAEDGPQVSREDGGGWEVVIGAGTSGARTYRVRGLTATGLDRLRVNLRITEGRQVHLDTLDLYSHRSRVALVRELAELFGSDEGDMSRELTTLIDTLERLRLEQGKDAESPAHVEMTDSEREAALRLLRAPDLIARLGADFEALGCVGETTSLTVGYLATISRLLDEPLGLMIVSRSGAGKSRLQETLCAMVPDESLMRYTRLTGQALFYQEEHALRHKVLAIDEEAGATEAAYSLRTLQSAQVLTVAATRTDPATGKLKTDEYRVEGPVVILFTTTSPEAMDYETRNRFVQVGVDESDEQTRRILARQRQADTLAGVLGRESASFTASVHQNAQRLLRPLKVVNPFASLLVYPDRSLQMRREQKKYLTLIKTIALLHQHQRPVKKARRGDAEVEYVEVTREDIVLANHLARQVLGRCLDELAPPTRQLLKHLVNLRRPGRPSSGGAGGTGAPGTPAPEKRAGGTFTRQDVRQATGWTDWQVRVHLRQLVELEYVVVASGCNGKRMTYELLFDGDPDEDLRYLDGLVDVAETEPAGATKRQLVREKATLRGPCEPHSQGRRPLPSVL
ncbi:MAG: DNA primase [Planctomycetota bacterium]|nr:MAG: DNA primase [Planctomycetota bacterium]